MATPIRIINTASITYNGQTKETCPAITHVEDSIIERHKTAYTVLDGAISQNPDIGREHDGVVGKDRRISYTLTLTNHNTVDALTNVVIVDTLGGLSATDFTLVESQPAGATVSGLNITFPAMTIEPQKTIHVTYVIDLKESIPVGTKVTNKAAISYNERPETQPNPETGDPGEPFYTEDLIVKIDYVDSNVTASKMGPETTICGKPLTYYLTFTNSGSQSAGVTQIIDDLPSGFSLIETNPIVITIPGQANPTFNHSTATGQLVITPTPANSLDIPAGKTMTVAITGIVACAINGPH